MPFRTADFKSRRYRPPTSINGGPEHGSLARSGRESGLVRPLGYQLGYQDRPVSRDWSGDGRGEPLRSRRYAFDCCLWSGFRPSTPTWSAMLPHAVTMAHARLSQSASASPETPGSSHSGLGLRRRATSSLPSLSTSANATSRRLSCRRTARPRNQTKVPTATAMTAPTVSCVAGSTASRNGPSRVVRTTIQAPAALPTAAAAVAQVRNEGFMSRRVEGRRSPTMPQRPDARRRQTSTAPAEQPSSAGLPRSAAYRNSAPRRSWRRGRPRATLAAWTG